MQDDPAASINAGREVIRSYVQTMRGAPGVYRMIAANGDVLYVGKASNLKKRVSSYVNVPALGVRLQLMVGQVASMEITETRSEAEALLLEANLIKKHRPRYNVLLKDDKSFPYILLSSHDYPRIVKHRGPKTPKGKYFGPFASAYAVNETVTLLQKAFLLRPCSDTIFKNRTRPCLQYQIKRCSGPCVGKIAKEDYDKLIEQAQAFLSGKSRQIQEQLIAEMQSLSLQMHYEKARVIRDRIRALAQVQHQHGTDMPSIGDADILALARDGKQCCIVMFSFRGGRNYGSTSWFPVHTGPYTEAEILRVFIGQRYQSQPTPAQIIVSHLMEEAGVLEEALRLHTDYKVEIIHPVRGEKRELIEQARRNAEQGLKRHMAMHATHREVLTGVKELFSLYEIPERIEVYDNSHISGTHAVGAMIVAGAEGFIKKEYRKFNIKREDTAPGDDYAMLREVLSRRFRQTADKEMEKDWVMPDLVLIDGGAGQLSTAAGVFEEIGIQVCFAAISKGPDRNAGREFIHIPGREPFQLPEGDPVLHFLQQIRDEAHRFAIGAHRKKRSKAMQMSQLDAIPAIGPSRKKALLHHFGSAKAVAAASIQEIERVEGISKTTAKIIYSHFHSGIEE